MENFANALIRAVALRHALERVHVNHVAHVHLRHVHLERGNAPASSIVLKKMGAILPPMQTEPARLFGTQGTCVCYASMASILHAIAATRTPRARVAAHVPQHGIRRRLARTTGADDVADVS